MSFPKRLDLDTGYIRDEYLSGVSEKALAERLGVGRPAIRRRLLELGINPRGRRESMFERMRRTSPDARRAMTAGANIARRGSKVSASEAHNKALVKQATLSKVGAGEEEFAELLRARGVETVPQLAAGPYNIDLSIADAWVAVEIHVSPSNPLGHPFYRRRIEYLVDSGWNVLYVWIGKTHPISTDSADKAVSFVQEAKSLPASIRQYGVIRGSGEFVTIAKVDLDHRPFVLPPADCFQTKRRND